jgi:propanol-preferring alcohol dehydrogenase
MKAMLLRQPRGVEQAPLEAVDLSIPVPGPREARLRVLACGVCHTDLHTVEGDLPLPRLPLVPGHQIVGVVDALGENATRFRPGDRVGAAWMRETCGRCGFCASGRENLCTDARFNGLHADGGYAEFAVVREDWAYRLPEGYPDAEAAPLLCAGIIGYRALRRSGVAAGSRLGLYGFGASAHLAIQVARQWGCEVYVFTRAPAHRDLARRLGAAWVGGAEDDPPAPPQASIIFAPAGGLVPRALEVLERGGTLVLAGVAMTAVPSLDYGRHLYHERRVLSVANNTRRDGEELMEMAAGVRLHVQVERFPLGQANDALLRLKQSRIQASAVLVPGAT